MFQKGGWFGIWTKGSGFKNISNVVLEIVGGVNTVCVVIKRLKGDNGPVFNPTYSWESDGSISEYVNASFEQRKTTIGSTTLGTPK